MTTIEVPDLSSLRAAGWAGVSDLRLFELLDAYAAAARLVDVGTAAISAEVGRRSSRELGYDGLAQRTGDRTPDALVARVTGTSAPEARQFVAAGRLLDAPAPWLTDVAAGLDAGDLSVAGADAIARGLGDPGAQVSSDDLLDAAKKLVGESARLTPEKLARRARDLRDELDAAGVIDREAALREKRFLRLTPLSDGMTRVFGMLDPESAALVSDAIDCVVSPRRGGPRFIDPDEVARADAIIADERTIEQHTLDALVDMVRIAGAADTGTVFGVRKPGVRVIVDARDLERGTGVARLEGQTAAVSVQTAERVACATGYLPVIVQRRGVLDVGVAQRFFTEKQRIAFAVTWGGCAVEGCSRPPAETEAHHLDPWSTGGPTDIDNGILLCKHHHLLLHNNAWTIHRPDPQTPGARNQGGGWMLVPPGGWNAGGVVKPVRLVRKGLVSAEFLAKR